ncbi:MAG TPA: NADH-quinone oxidoreductase subunit H [Armatimonadota bacterium]|jgi:formate hydrogenlyase subunit 4
MNTVLLFVNLAVLPLLLVGVIRKAKALMQTRLGAPVWQPFFDIAKLLRKGETISTNAGWVFVWAPRIALVVALATACLVPWAGPLLPPSWGGATNLILVVYLMGLGRFVSLLAAMDTGSAFGGLGASREATISLLIEPAVIAGLAALALGAGSTDLAKIYAAPMDPIIAGLVGVALVVAALAELSRMPVDDPTTHLELTMVHEAMILENSGRNLALVEYAVALRSCVLLGLAAQTLLRTVPGFLALADGPRYALSVAWLFGIGVVVAMAEGVLVKLKWRSVPGFLVYSVGLSLLAALLAVAKG